MAFDGYTGVNSNAVVNITETTEDLTAFKNCIDPGEKSVFLLLDNVSITLMTLSIH